VGPVGNRQPVVNRLKGELFARLPGEALR
jgi:hypothetical protein